jgi:GTP pyrophosphokinase
MRIEDIEEQVVAYNPKANLDLIRRSYIFAAKVHKGQARLSGEPYLYHPLEVASVLTQLKMDPPTIAAGILHDAVEDTLATVCELRGFFGDETANLVEGVTKISKIAFSSKEERQAESFRKMVLAMAKDIRVLIIKLADRLHNMRTLEPFSDEKRKRISQETLDIYAPLAHRLGIAWIKWELEDLAFRYLQPEAYYELVEKVAKKRKEREGEINELIKLLVQKLKEMDIEAQISGRPKHFYSIYKKMRHQGKAFEEIYDLTAVRVLCHNIKDCYGTLGVVHGLWKPIPGRFKDFVAMPKINLYQSLHTTVIGPKGEPVEIQIRTKDMHKVAEEGIAAHWKYKEGKAEIDQDDKTFAWMRQLLEWQQDLKESKEFMDTVKVELLPDEVYVFTPKGDVRGLPRGATPVDFAYSIHTDVGNRCVGAKVNGRLVPLSHNLNNGDIVEINTNPHHKPSKDWLKFIKTSRAISRVKQFIKAEQRTRSIALGREMLEKEIKKLGKSPANLMKSERLQAALTRMGLPNEDELLVHIGYGKISGKQAAIRLLTPEEQAQLPAVLEEKEKKALKAGKPPVEEGIKIKGVDNVLIRFSKCCNPLPGDEIIGFITRGRGVSIHTADCPNIESLSYDPERHIRVEWEVDKKVSHPVKISVLAGEDRPGLLAEITAAISSSNANITEADVKVTEDRRGINTFVLEIKDVVQLQQVMQAIMKVKGVMGVERLRTAVR